MRIAHWGIYAPNRSGMYHTTKDIILAQRDIGIDCAMIDATDGVAKTDGEFATETFHYADTADVYMMHLAVPEPYFSDGTPIAIVLHGSPLYSMQTELYGLESSNPTPYSTILGYFSRSEPTWFVSMWEDEQAEYWDVIDGDRTRLRYIPRGIRFADEWTPEGRTRDLEGDPCIVIADQFRYFKDAIPSLYGAYHYWLRNPKARVYLYGLPPKNSKPRDALDSWIGNSGLHRMMGGMFEIVDYLPEVFRRADVLLSTVTGESRVVLEAMASGCPCVAPADCVTQKVGEFWRPSVLADAIEAVCGSADRQDVAQGVRKQYDLRKTAQGFKALYEEILGAGEDTDGNGPNAES